MFENPAFRIPKLVDSGCNPDTADPHFLLAPPSRSSSCLCPPCRSTEQPVRLDYHYHRPGPPADMDRLTQKMGNQSLATADVWDSPQSPEECLPMPPPVPETNSQISLPSSRQRAETQPGPSGSENRALSQKRMRRPTDVRLTRNPSLQNLVTNMIEHGVQCNVQVSEMPLVATRPPSPVNSNSKNLEDTAMLNSHAWPNVGDGDDDDEMLSLRRTIGCRRAGIPFMTASEAALQCKNVKRNIPRRRKRPKVPNPATAPPKPA